ncbi:TetR family transcriptional regulator [Glaciihabitans tibetensis]|uniref:TetR family transcriptional regulator n=1 Tax=Glaciihabitans tibetensis TaxID=1266600 RepID=A0A2T0V5I0_9MICO|nr:TetR/AcrR family transcriptional regulator [Glaciihabitans tibetensis]PRY65449.1 TetR family transcriptional regulator [Glaciihabitans tibetensis]
MTSVPTTARASRVQAVLDATSAALIEGGYASLTVDRIAMQAHASKATIYKSWPTKIDLVCAVASSIEPTMIAVPGIELDHVAAITSIAQAVRSITTGQTGRLLLALHEASRAEQRINDAVDEHLVVPHQAAIATALRSLQLQSRIAAHVDPVIGGRVIASLIVDRALVSGEPISEDELDTIVTHWLAPALDPRGINGRTLGPPAGPG